MQLVVRRRLEDAAPTELFVLAVALAELPGDLCAGEFQAQVERVRRVVVDVQPGKEIVGVDRGAQPVPVVYMDAFVRDLDAEVRVLHVARELRDFLRRVRKRFALVQREQALVDVARRHVVLARRIHHAPRVGDFAHDTPAVAADLGRQHRGDVQFRCDAEQQRVHAEGVGVRELGEVADAHHDRRGGIALAQLAITQHRVGESVVDGIEDRVGEVRPAARRIALDCAAE